MYTVDWVLWNTDIKTEANNCRYCLCYLQDFDICYTDLFALQNYEWIPPLSGYKVLFNKRSVSLIGEKMIDA